MKELYDMIFKRKSMRKFDETQFLTREELVEIRQETEKLISIDDDIRVKFEIVKRESTTAEWGEYCLLIYSEKKPHYLLNVGYLLEQMDLYLASHDIGACWYGMAETKEKQVEGLDYVVMLAFGKSQPQDFRREVSEFKRYNREEIWRGNFNTDVMDAVRLAPSACNSQPWRMVSDGNCIKVYRNTIIRSFIPDSKLPYYNAIDMGICLCFLEISMMKKGYEFDRRLIVEENSNLEFLQNAIYFIK